VSLLPSSLSCPPSNFLVPHVCYSKSTHWVVTCRPLDPVLGLYQWLLTMQTMASTPPTRMFPISTSGQLRQIRQKALTPDHLAPLSPQQIRHKELGSWLLLHKAPAPEAPCRLSRPQVPSLCAQKLGPSCSWLAESMPHQQFPGCATYRKQRILLSGLSCLASLMFCGEEAEKSPLGFRLLHSTGF
jgi:hypothetical protein